MVPGQVAKVGGMVSKIFLDPSSTFGASPTRSKTPAENFKFDVWNYSEDFTPVIDATIIQVLTPPEVNPKPKRNRISAIKIKTNG